MFEILSQTYDTYIFLWMLLMLYILYSIKHSFEQQQPCYLYTHPRYISKTDMSAGDTPEILDACPIDAGLCSFSF